MGIKRTYGAEAVAGLGYATGKDQADKEAAARAFEASERRKAQQADQQYRDGIRQQNVLLELEKNERAKRWEIDKMQLRSQMDFEREEKERARKMETADNALSQIDKELDAGRMSESEAYPLQLKFKLDKQGMDVPQGLLPDDHDDKFGMKPHWVEWLQPQFKGTQKQAYAMDKLTSYGEDSVQAIPWYLSPRLVATKGARDYREGVGIELSEQDIRDYQFGQEPDITQEPATQPPILLADFDPTKTIVGTRVQGPDGVYVWNGIDFDKEGE